MLYIVHMVTRVALITGSARGIGAAIASSAIERNMKVILHGRNESTHLLSLAQKLEVPYVVFDITDQQSVRNGVSRALQIYGRIDILINSAGNVLPGSTSELEELSWVEQYKTNVVGTACVVKEVAAIMMRQKYGSIVSLSSIHGHNTLASEGVAAYSASKAAVLNLTVSWAREFAPYVRVNSVSPGFTVTDISATWPDHVWEQAKKNLIARAAQPDDITGAVLFLAGDEASFITGQDIIVDGGYGITNR